MQAKKLILGLSEKIEFNRDPQAVQALNVCGISNNSKYKSKDFLFCALRGSKADGHDFLEEAKQNGAVLALVEKFDPNCDLPQLKVKNSAAAASLLAAQFFDEPAKKMRTVAVTGTNGKTTINWLIHQLLGALGIKALRIGTLGIQFGDETFVASDLTTPGSIDVQRSLHSALQQRVYHAVMEASSHGLDQHRLDNCHFDIGIFSNLTRDHLDYHRSMENYFKSKRRLFELLFNESVKNKKLAVINSDDPYGRKLAQEFQDQAILSYGLGEDCLLKAQGVTATVKGSAFELHYQGNRYQCKVPLIGVHNCYNVLAAVGAVMSLGINLETLVALLPKLAPSAWAASIDTIQKGSRSIDYAHTPDALENVLKTLKPLTPNRLWVLFGCGGDRDRGKRPQMAKIACSLADKIVLTSDNPRTEDPRSIIEDILKGESSGKITNTGIIEIDRRLAIQRTIEEVKEGDVVLVAGKGHEDYQIVGHEKLPFSDFQEIKARVS